jgi:apolipoprotein N-acyltransferase
LAALAGACAAFGHAPFDLWVLTPIALAGLLRLIASAATARRAAVLAWVGGTAYFALSLNWLVAPFLVDARATGWMAPFALVAMAGGMALFWAPVGWLVQRYIAQDHMGHRLAVLAGLLVLAEAARGVILTGFPWAHPGHVLIGSPLLPVAGVVGALGLTALVLGVAAGIASFGPKAPLRALAVLSVPLLAGIAVMGSAQPAPMPQDTAPIIRLVQPNAPQHLKWREDLIPVFFQRSLDLTAQAPVDPAVIPDVILWSETTLPVLLNRSDAARARIATAAGGAQVLVGAQRFQGFYPRNSAALLASDGQIAAVYDKHRLVPFGEYMPGGAVAAALGLRGMAEVLNGGYVPGPGPRVLDLGGALGRVFPMICYEAIFARDIRRVSRPDWMAHLTNDAWFGSLSGPYQHLALARLRAAEQGLPVLRAANTGVSAVIDARGHVIAALPLNVSGVLDARLPPALPPTIYARLGDTPILLLVLLATAVLTAHARRSQALRSGA